MERFVKKFWTEENGNATVDWMILTAGLILLSAALVASFAKPSQALAEDTTVTEAAVASNTDV